MFLGTTPKRARKENLSDALSGAAIAVVDALSDALSGAAIAVVDVLKGKKKAQEPSASVMPFLQKDQWNYA